MNSSDFEYDPSEWDDGEEFVSKTKKKSLRKERKRKIKEKEDFGE